MFSRYSLNVPRMIAGIFQDDHFRMIIAVIVVNNDYNDCIGHNHFNHYNDYNHYNQCNHYNHNNHNNHYSEYNDYRDSDLDLDLD